MRRILSGLVASMSLVSVLGAVVVVCRGVNVTGPAGSGSAPIRLKGLDTKSAAYCSAAAKCSPALRAALQSGLPTRPAPAARAGATNLNTKSASYRAAETACNTAPAEACATTS